MNNLVIGELIEEIKRGILWFIVTVIFATKELKEEAGRHFYSGVIRISGVYYGHDLVKGYREIGRLFPDRRHIVRLDYITGYVKTLLMVFCVVGLSALLARYVT